MNMDNCIFKYVKYLNLLNKSEATIKSYVSTLQKFVKDEKINEYFKKNQYNRIIEIYEKRLLDIQKNEKKMARKQRLKSFVRRLIKE